MALLVSKRRSLTRRQTLVGSFAAALVALYPAARAQAFPSKPIRLVVAFPAGGGADVLARALGQKLSAGVGQPVIVENRVGASGIVGSDFVAKSPPDGHVLLMTSTTQAIASKLYPKVPFDLAKSFTPVTFIGTAPLVLVAHPSLPARSLQDLIQLARTRPISYASAASGTVGHLSMELLKAMAKFEMLHVPYRGTTPATTDLIGGQVDAMMDILPNSLPHVKSGRLRALAVTSMERAADLPEVPTVSQSGVPGFEALNWYGILAPAGMPAPLVAQINASISSALTDPDVAGRLAAQGYVVTRMAPDDFGRMIESDLQRWDKAIKDSGTKPE